MRILQIVTLVSPTGEYGGPVRVAFNQAAALKTLGHDVEIAASTRGFEPGPRMMDGIKTHLFRARRAVPGTGFAGIAAPAMLRWLRVNFADYDLLHIHAARDLVTLPAAQMAQRRGVPLVLQTHGMIGPSSNIMARPLDRVLTRPALRAAHETFYLTRREQEDLISVGGTLKDLSHLPNGVPRSGLRANMDAKEVIFVGRLHERKRPTAFVRAALRLTDAYPDWRFTLIGPDEGEGQRVVDLITGAPAISWERAIPPDQVLGRMARAAVYCLPSVDEPFPMSVLEALSVGLPVIVTQSNGLATTIEASKSGSVVGESETELTRALETFIVNARLREKTSDHAVHHSEMNFSMDVVARRLDGVYQRRAPAD